MRNDIEAALANHPLTLPETLKKDFLDEQYELNFRALLLLCIVGHLLALLGGAADRWLMPETATESLVVRVAFCLTVFPLSLLAIFKLRQIEWLEFLLAQTVVVFTVLWFELLMQSADDRLASDVYASLGFFVIANLIVRVNFNSALFTTALLAAISLYYVFMFTHGDAAQLAVYAMIALPVAGLSLCISGYSARASRHSFLYTRLDKINRAELQDLRQQLWRQSHIDALTGIPNKTLFNDRVQQAIIKARRENLKLAILFVDLGHFRPINEMHGHAVGDCLLTEVAKRMVGCIRESDTVARAGGDEFFVLLPVIEEIQDALRVAEKIRQAIAQPFEVSGLLLEVDSCIGIASFPKHASDFEALCRQAETALYRAKVSGRDRIELVS